MSNPAVAIYSPIAFWLTVGSQQLLTAYFCSLFDNAVTLATNKKSAVSTVIGIHYTTGDCTAVRESHACHGGMGLPYYTCWTESPLSETLIMSESIISLVPCIWQQTVSRPSFQTNQIKYCYYFKAMQQQTSVVICLNSLKTISLPLPHSHGVEDVFNLLIS